MSAGLGDAERLPWLEPYREPGTTAAASPRGSRAGLAAVAIVGLAVITSYSIHYTKLYETIMPPIAAPMTTETGANTAICS